MTEPNRDIELLAQRARQAAEQIKTLDTQRKNECLLDLAGRIDAQVDRLRQANAADLAAARAAGLSEAKLRRLALSDGAMAQMSAGLRQIATLDDPVGRVVKDYVVPSGLAVQKVRAPLGVILMIYEARPNVTIDAFALCFKAGNACLLKGGREARESNQALCAMIQETLRDHQIPAEAVQLLTTSDRDQLRYLLTLDQYIDLAIPRGGAELIRFVHEHARIPTVQHFQGVCHIFVDASADLNAAVEICATAKTSAPAACNAVETVLIHETVAAKFVPVLAERYTRDGVEMRGDETVCGLDARIHPAAADDWGREFLDLIVAIKVVPSLAAAMDHIRRYNSNHTEAILTRDEVAARTFVEQVQSSCVLVNASTRFNDGFQLGLGAEIGISTSRIHAYGPMGLEELTTQRYIVRGAGQTR